MKKVTMILLASVICSGAAMAKSAIFYQAPFHNVEIKAASKIYVDYGFNPHNQVLVCSSAQADAITSIEWSYKDATRKIGLPVTLKDSPRFNGYLADPEGKLVISNEFGSDADGSDGSIFVSCDYQNQK